MYKVVKLSKKAQAMNEPYRYAVKLGTRVIEYTVTKDSADRMAAEYNRNIQSNPSKKSLIRKLRKGIRGTVKISHGRLIIKT